MTLTEISITEYSILTVPFKVSKLDAYPVLPIREAKNAKRIHLTSSRLICPTIDG